MALTKQNLISVFLRGVGLKTTLSFVPPCTVAWVFFLLYLHTIYNLDISAFRTALWLGLAAIGGGSVVVVILILSIVPPLQRIIAATHALRRGELDEAIPYRTRTDEIGEMAEALATFQQTARDKVGLEREQTEQKQRAEAERRAALNALAESFEAEVGGVVKSVVHSVTQLRGSSQSMADTARATSAQVGTVARAAKQASDNVQKVAETTEQLAGSITEISHQVRRAQLVTERADKEAHDTTDMIRKLADSVTGIGEIVALINDIAAQTNLLALNATIEAARAGEAGKGFAVVANEVKHLATQTGRATEDITGRIHAIQSGTAEAVQAMSSIAATIGEMTGISGAVAEAVERQDQATGAIVRNVDDVAVGTEQVSQNIEQVGGAAEITGNTAADISQAANALAEQSTLLTREVDRFVKQVRT